MLGPAVAGGFARRVAVVYRPALVLLCVGAAVFPAELALAQAHTQSGIEALNAGLCTRAEADARAAIARLDAGARPYELLGLCTARRGAPRSAVAWARIAVAHDPHNWEPHYVLALAEGVAGLDPRSESMMALAYNPRGELSNLGVLAFRKGDRRHWRRVALALPFSFD
jgi:hypothetical protein